MAFKHLNIDEILKNHSNETLTPRAIRRINEEITAKEQAWLNQRDD